MDAEVSNLLHKTKTKLSKEEYTRDRRVARALITHIESATPMRDGEHSFSTRLKSNWSGKFLLFCIGFFGGVSVVMAVTMRLFGS